MQALLLLIAVVAIILAARFGARGEEAGMAGPNGRLPAVVTPEHARRVEMLLGRAAVPRLLREADVDRAYAVLRAGLEATRRRAFQYEGAILYGEAEVDWEERRECAREVLRLADHYPNRLEHEVAGEVSFVLRGLTEAEI